MNPDIIVQMFSLGLLFVVFATGAWRKSISTLVYIIVQALAVFFYFNASGRCSGFILVTGGTILVIRAMYHQEHDKLLKKRN